MPKISLLTHPLKFHPDKHNNDEFFKERFQEVQEAYDYLIKEEHYDEFQNKEYTVIDKDDIILNCTPKQVPVGGTITINWVIYKECKCSIMIEDDNNSNRVFSDIGIKGKKKIKIKNNCKEVCVTIVCQDQCDNVLETKSEIIDVCVRDILESIHDSNDALYWKAKKLGYFKYEKWYRFLTNEWLPFITFTTSLILCGLLLCLYIYYSKGLRGDGHMLLFATGAGFIGMPFGLILIWIGDFVSKNIKNKLKAILYELTNNQV